MNRPDGGDRPPLYPVPQISGDEPTPMSIGKKVLGTFPPWGRQVFARERTTGRIGTKAPGMVEGRFRVLVYKLKSIPHGRGDEPEPRSYTVQEDPVFPTDVGMNRRSRNRSKFTGSVFPTDVGMNRSAGAAKTASFRIPHGRGDEPFRGSGQMAHPLHSPRTWG